MALDSMKKPQQGVNSAVAQMRLGILPIFRLILFVQVAYCTAMTNTALYQFKSLSICVHFRDANFVWSLTRTLFGFTRFNGYHMRIKHGRISSNVHLHSYHLLSLVPSVFLNSLWITIYYIHACFRNSHKKHIFKFFAIVKSLQYAFPCHKRG